MCWLVPLLLPFSSQASQDEAAKQKEMLTNELKCLREELKQIRDDRDRQQLQVQTLMGDVEKYKEYTGKSCAQLDTLTIKTNALEVCGVVLSLPFGYYDAFANYAHMCSLDL